MKDFGKLSKISLWALMLIGVVVAVVFFLAGNEAEGYEVAGDILAVPKCTGLFLTWNYVLFALAILATLVFVCAGFVSSFKQDKKQALTTLGVLVGFVLLFVICWLLGSPEKLHIIGYEGTDNQGFWANLSDMMIYATYALVLGTICTLVWGVIYSKLKK